MKVDIVALFAVATLFGLANAINVKDRLKLFEDLSSKGKEEAPFYRNRRQAKADYSSPSGDKGASGPRQRKPSRGMRDLLDRFESKKGQDSPVEKGREIFDYKGHLAVDPRSYKRREPETGDETPLLEEKEARESAVAKRRRELEERVKRDAEAQQMQAIAAQRRREAEMAENFRREEALRQAREQERIRMAREEEENRLREERRRAEERQKREKEVNEALMMRERELEREEEEKKKLQDEIERQSRQARRRAPPGNKYRQINKSSSPGSAASGSLGLAKEDQKKLAQIMTGRDRFQGRPMPGPFQPRGVTTNKIFGGGDFGNNSSRPMHPSFEGPSAGEVDALLREMGNPRVTPSALDNAIRHLMSFSNSVDPMNVREVMQRQLNMGNVAKTAIIANASCPIFFSGERPLDLTFPINLDLNGKHEDLRTICQACPNRGSRLQSMCRRLGIN